MKYCVDCKYYIDENDGTCTRSVDFDYVVGRGEKWMRHSSCEYERLHRLSSLYHMFHGCGINARFFKEKDNVAI